MPKTMTISRSSFLKAHLSYLIFILHDGWVQVKVGREAGARNVAK
ncbi:hypothetical protein KP77_32010 [Jeotgalibacillus alimentarius]|uniref:Uncharacterized protein n=1 Tax=Jeotgalibacillus alimentarius TaxID=135826 RepID=A0A0C2RP31_9BACL|nr:hypothetical protein KP77_32010 [Jeotgalibacillus alimentarius]